MRTYLLALTIAVLCLAGCAKPKYLVKGLTLPSGSTVINEMESKQVSMQIPMLGEVDKAITVSFDCAKDWDAVAAHVESAMSKQGYEESFSQLGSMIPGGSAPMQDQIMSSMRMWSKMGGEYQVMLTNNSAMMGAAGGSRAEGFEMPGMGDYTLTVIRYKEEK